MVLSRALGRLTPILAKMANEKEIATIVLDSDGDDGADTVYYYMQAEQ